MSTVQIIEGVNPTRMELLALKDRLKLAEKGYDLLKEKLEALTNELFIVITRYREISDRARKILQEADQALTEARMVMGTLKIKEVSLEVPQVYSVDVRTKNLMGVAVPFLQLKKDASIDSEVRYSLRDTPAKLDDAVLKFEEALSYIIRLAETLSALTRLSQEITDTKRRVNALNYVIIPRIKATTDWISLTLAEREREEFVRLKKIKKKLQAPET